MEVDSDDLLTIRGAFNQIKSVREGRGWLYISKEQSIIGDIIALDAANLTAVFVAPPPYSAVTVAQRFPYLDGYWDASDVAMVLEGQAAWKRVTFQATDAVEFRDPKVLGYVAQKPVRQNDSLPEGATLVQVRKGGWDHEHCKLCWEKIGIGGAEKGYQNTENQWLCEECYTRYVVEGSLSFIYER
jgi:hypothetical protein